MSVKQIAQVYERQLDSKLLSLLVVLADFANDEGICWPSQPLIAWKLGCSDRTVKRGIAALIACKAIQRHSEVGKANVYRLRLDRLPVKAVFIPPTHGFGGFVDDEDDEDDETTDTMVVPGTPPDVTTGPCDTPNVTGDNQGQTGDNQGQTGDNQGTNQGHSHVPLTVNEPSMNRQEPSVPGDANDSSDGHTGHDGGDPSMGQALVGSMRPKRSRAKDKYPLPDDFTVSDGMRQWARDHVGLSDDRLGHETEKFRNHALAQDRRQADWTAAWRNWMLNGVEFAAARTGGSGTFVPTPKPSVFADDPLGRLDAEIERVRTSRDVEYLGSAGRERRTEDIARLEAERDRLRAADPAVAA